VKNLSGSEIYEEEWMKQKKQKTANFLKKTRESEATICFKWKQWSQDMNWHNNYIKWTLVSDDQLRSNK